MSRSSKFELTVLVSGVIVSLVGWFMHPLILILGIVTTLAGLFLFFGGLVLPQ